MGQKVRAERDQHDVKINPFTAGVYIAVMMATVQTLQEKGHPYSEICNEVSTAQRTGCLHLGGGGGSWSGFERSPLWGAHAHARSYAPPARRDPLLSASVGWPEGMAALAPLAVRASGP